MAESERLVSAGVYRRRVAVAGQGDGRDGRGREGGEGVALKTRNKPCGCQVRMSLNNYHVY